MFFSDIPDDSGFPINRERSFESPLVDSSCLTNNIERVLSARVLHLI